MLLFKKPLDKLTMIDYIIQEGGLGCKIDVIEAESSKDENKELVDDMLALITSFSARLYGKEKQEIIDAIGK